MSEAGAQLMTWFGAACELHRDWRNDIEGLGTLFSNHIPDYRNLITSYTTLAQRSEEHTSELQSLMRISYAVFCLKKKKYKTKTNLRKSEVNQHQTPATQTIH